MNKNVPAGKVLHRKTVTSSTSGASGPPPPGMVTASSQHGPPSNNSRLPVALGSKQQKQTQQQHRFANMGPGSVPLSRSSHASGTKISSSSGGAGPSGSAGHSYHHQHHHQQIQQQQQLHQQQQQQLQHAHHLQQQQQQHHHSSAIPINVHLIWPIVIRPLLCKIQKRNQSAAVALLNGLGRAENNEPGFLLDLVTTMLASRNIKVNMTEKLLLLQGNIPESEEQRCRRPEEPFQELNRKTYMLKKILSRIPSEIVDRKLFLETIKEIASAIKKLLDCVNRISTSGFLTTYQDKKALDSRKRDFIRDSKNFSQTLKEFFKGGDEQVVYESAAQLIYATNSIQKTIKSRCDYKA